VLACIRQPVRSEPDAGYLDVAESQPGSHESRTTPG
jgi:hypothetical protein